jgi:hypothetical protein
VRGSLRRAVPRERLQRQTRDMNGRAKRGVRFQRRTPVSIHAKASRGFKVFARPSGFEGLLLGECVAVRPVVLAPLALRAPGTLNAGRGASQTSRRARRRVLRLELANNCCRACTRTTRSARSWRRSRILGRIWQESR